MLKKEPIYSIIELQKKRKEVVIMYKKILSFIVVLCLIFTAMPIIVSAASVFAGGSGTETDPYIIKNTSQLNEIRNYSSSHFVLGNDIVFTEQDYATNGKFYNSGSGWKPISTFSGTLNGNGFSIVLLYTYLENKDNLYAGFIATNKGTVHSLIMEECYIVADANKKSYAGAVAAINEGDIVQCYSDGYVYAVNAKTSYAGGICAVNSGTITLCKNSSLVDSEGETFKNTYVSGGITGVNEGDGAITYSDNHSYIYGKNAGGIVGHSNGGTIVCCRNTGFINKDTKGYDFLCSGGIVGKSNNGTLIQCCINSAYVYAASSVENVVAGGIAGYNTNSQIADSYNTGYIRVRFTGEENTDIFVGGIVGVNYCDKTNEFFDDSIYNVYNDGMTCKNKIEKQGGGIAGKTNCHIVNAYYNMNTAIYGVSKSSEFEQETTDLDDIEMTDYTYFKGFDFKEMWWLHTESGYWYPQLTLLSEEPAVSVSEIKGIDKVFFVGNEPDFSGGTMEVNFKFNEKVTIDASNIAFLTEFDVNKVGVQSAVAIYAGYAFVVDVTFIKEKPDSLVIDSLPKQLDYVDGQKLDLSNLSVSAVYDDFKMSLDSEALQISYDENALGKVEVNVAYKDVATSFYVNVVPRVISHITVHPNAGTLRKTNDGLLVKAMYISVHFELPNGEYSENVNLSADMIAGYDLNKLGLQTATVTYEGKTATFEFYLVDENSGDVNGDGVIDTIDLAMLKLYLAGVEDSIVSSTSYADYNCDLSVDTIDLASLKIHLAYS